MYKNNLKTIELKDIKIMFFRGGLIIKRWKWFCKI